MKDKLLSLQPSTWYSLEGRPDRNEITATIKQLQNEREQFVFSDDETKFMQLSSDIWDSQNEHGFKVVKRGKHEDLYFENRLIAIK